MSYHEMPTQLDVVTVIVELTIPIVTRIYEVARREWPRRPDLAALQQRRR